MSEQKQEPWAGSLCETTKAELESLKSEGITPTLEQSLWLNGLVRKLENPDPPSPIATGKPGHAGKGVWLWPFTVQADEWFSYATAVNDWFPDEESEQHALCFALAHGRVKGFFRNLYNETLAVNAVDAWWRNCPATPLGLLEALQVVMDQGDVPPILPDSVDNKKDEDAVPTSSEETIAFISLMQGGDPELWEWAVSHRYLLRLAEMAQTIQAAEGGVEPKQEHSTIVAVRRIGEAVIAIKRWHAKSPS